MEENNIQQYETKETTNEDDTGVEKYEFTWHNHEDWLE